MKTPARAGFALALCAVAGASSGHAQDTAFTSATLIDGTGEPPVRDAVIVVRAGRITCVGTRAACPTAGAQIIDLAGRWVMPGLVDAHVHYSQTGWVDGRPDALDMRARFPYIETIARLRDPAPFYRANLCAGVTATFDVGGYPWTWRLRQDAENDPAAPHVAAAGPLLSTRDHWLNVPGERQFLFMSTDSATADGARYLAANHTDAIKVWYLAGATSPDTAGLKQRLGVAAAEAQRSGIPLIVHATSLWAATQAVLNGAHLLVHGVGDRPVDDAFLEAARRAGTIYTPTLVVNAGYRQVQARRFDAAAYVLECVDPVTRARAFLTDSLPGRPDDAALIRSREAAQRQDSLAALNLMRVHQAGIPVAMGTDAGNPLTLHGPSVYLEMEAMHAAGMSAMDVIVAATRNGARAMRREDDFGTLERGRIADMLILQADPLADIRNTRRVDRVVRAGRVWGRDQLAFPPAEGFGPDGRAWLPLHDSTGAITRADAALAASPRNVEHILAAAAARAAVWRYREAIDLYSRAIELAPGDWRPYRFRGHRFLSLRRFDDAVRDLQRAASLDSLSFDVAYHLGLAHYLSGDFSAAADAYARCMGRATDSALLRLETSGSLPQGYRSCMRMSTDDDDRVAMTDWRYRALRRAGRHAEAERLLDTIREDMQVQDNTSYLHAMLVYKGLRTEAETLDPSRLSGNQLETIGYGIASWHLARGDTTRAHAMLRRIVQHGTRWNAFGFIAAETDLQRLSPRPRPRPSPRPEGPAHRLP